MIESVCKRIQQLHKKIQASLGNHSLYYIHTVLLREDGLEITGMGLLDDQPVEIYRNQTWVPKTEWMKNNMPSQYWQRGISEKQNRTVLDIMQDSCAYKDSAAICVLQWRVGCEAEQLANDSLMLVKKVEEYHLNGEATKVINGSSQWGAAPFQPSPQAEEILTGARNISHNFSDFLLKECVDQMRKFIIYNNDREPSAPMVTVFPPKKKSRFCFLQTCMATGFYPRHIEMSFHINGVPVPDKDGVRSSGTIPNGDGTFQLRKSLKIMECHMPFDVLYECVVEHTATGTAKTQTIMKLDGTCGLVLRIRGGIVLVSLILLLLSHAVFSFCMKRKTSCSPAT
ncbi:MHC class I polypeptide-related sequence B-like [Sardina pilchardus]|uniref:MHC class I polypeptide-related sequence B-like n=1 Tax=Sardina pilchardus TaxID=27697 RepID=UPI002E134811